MSTPMQPNPEENLGGTPAGPTGYNPYETPAASQYGQPNPPQDGQQPPYGQAPYGAPQQQYPAGYQPQMVYTDPYAKSRLVAGLLGIFLGSLGIHRFYLGYNGIGVAQILVTIFTFGIGGIWGFVEGIMILAGASSFQTDATGRPLAQ